MATDREKLARELHRIWLDAYDGSGAFSFDNDTESVRNGCRAEADFILKRESALKSQLQKKDEALREAEKAIKDVSSYAKHSEGCNAPFDVRYGCKCGFYSCGEDTDKVLSKIRAALKEEDHGE